MPWHDRASNCASYCLYSMFNNEHGYSDQPTRLNLLNRSHIDCVAVHPYLPRGTCGRLPACMDMSPALRAFPCIPFPICRAPWSKSHLVYRWVLISSLPTNLTLMSPALHLLHAHIPPYCRALWSGCYSRWWWRMRRWWSRMQGRARFSGWTNTCHHHNEPIV